MFMEDICWEPEFPSPDWLTGSPEDQARRLEHLIPKVRPGKDPQARHGGANGQLTSNMFSLIHASF